MKISLQILEDIRNKYEVIDTVESECYVGNIRLENENYTLMIYGTSVKYDLGSIKGCVQEPDNIKVYHNMVSIRCCR